ncbi:hypothetical protein GCM10009682_03910 [Luedemannella flava]|uniref:Uncharacterized protein n=1 Tax=Luedemannella flava TaxID=349316 RepID=A0ABN2LET9_9ACTN
MFPRAFATYTSRSGAVVQHNWNPDATLRLEHLDPATRTSHGRLASPAEVDQVITALALEDRVTVADLGPLDSTTW